MKLSQNVDLIQLGKITPGFVGADLAALAREAGMIAVTRIITTNNRFDNNNKNIQIDTKNENEMIVLNENISENSINNENINEINTENENKMIIETENNNQNEKNNEIENNNENENEISIDMNDFIKASKTVQPTAKREGFAVVPNVSWDDVGALIEIREELLHNVLEPISNPERFRSLGLEIPAGVLFFGPPG